MKYAEISHFSHTQHNLKFDYTEKPFKCDGCNEVGIGSRYRCSGDDNGSCDFDLHAHCALPSAFITHPFYKKCSFQFMARPPGNERRYCNACEKDVSGFVYHCKACGFDLHPCCAMLPMVLDDGETKLFLYRKVSSSCHRCGRKGRSWSYRFLYLLDLFFFISYYNINQLVQLHDWLIKDLACKRYKIFGF